MVACTDVDFRKKSNQTENLHELSSEITIYPNPVMDKFTVKTAGFAEEISVFDASGKEVNINLINSTSADIAHLKSGLYFIKIKLNHKTVVKKIVKYWGNKKDTNQKGLSFFIINFGIFNCFTDIFILF